MKLQQDERLLQVITSQSDATFESNKNKQGAPKNIITTGKKKKKIT